MALVAADDFSKTRQWEGKKIKDTEELKFTRLYLGYLDISEVAPDVVAGVVAVREADEGARANDGHEGVEALVTLIDECGLRARLAGVVTRQRQDRIGHRFAVGTEDLDNHRRGEGGRA